MSTTVFCTFEQQDLADLAVGKLRASGLQIRSIHYIEDRSRENPGALNAFYALTADTYAQPTPERPVTLKIVCPDAKSDALISHLINMHGYKIIKTR